MLLFFICLQSNQRSSSHWKPTKKMSVYDRFIVLTAIYVSTRLQTWTDSWRHSLRKIFFQRFLYLRRVANFSAIINLFTVFFPAGSSDGSQDRLDRALPGTFSWRRRQTKWYDPGLAVSTWSRGLTRTHHSIHRWSW